ncbi:hypothetical protein [Myceligenerans indicum]|uniref:Uncharacterized protein n=1 Tax=Myceligenerans indicum TaxID=2593663 RepID=A0ABS1LNN0_9MICO|nr:hypothetical protein [Myceligenerans indicum]MBL0887840.1 hypothetical protein [Myceligenerans indicum]
MEQLAREHEAAFGRDLAQLRDALDLAKDYGTEIDPRRPSQGDRLSPPGYPVATPGFDTPHDDLLGSLPRTTDTAPYGNAGPSEGSGARELGAAARPSSDPRDWVGGAASQDRGNEPDVVNQVDDNTTQRLWYFDDGGFIEELTTKEGGVRATTIFSYEAASGERSGETSLYDQDGLVIRTTFRARQDGSSSGSTRVRNGGTYTIYIWDKPAEDQPAEGRTEKTTGEDVKKDIATLPGTEAGSGSALAQAFARRFDHSKKTGARVPTLVNPGDPDYQPDDTGPRLKPGPGLVDVHRPAPRPISREQAERWQKEVKDRAGGRVNPPDPNDLP